MHLAACEFKAHSPGRWIHSLTVLPGPSMSTLSQTPIAALFLYAPNLRSFSSPVDASPPDILPLVRMNKGALRRLDILIGGEHSLGGITLGLIGALPALRDLSVTVGWNSDSSVFAVADAPPFHLPALTRLRWATQRRPIKPFLAFLAACTFPALAHLELALPELDAPDVHLLHPFLAAHGAQLARLALAVPTPHIAALLSYPASGALEELRFPAAAPQPHFVELLPPSVRALHVPLNSSGADTLALLRALADAPATHALRDVCVIGRAGRFAWRTLGQTSAELAGQLLHVSFMLAERGINLLDEDGATLRLTTDLVGGRR